MSTLYDEKARAYMLHLRGTGKNNDQIAKIIGCGKATVQRYIGHSPFENPGRRAKWRIPETFPGYGTAEQEEKPGVEKSIKVSDLEPLMIFLRGLGLSYRQIGEKIGISYMTVRRHIGPPAQEEKPKTEQEQKQQYLLTVKAV